MHIRNSMVSEELSRNIESIQTNPSEKDEELEEGQNKFS